ncbi:lipopolysaccharide biosynthesis protein [Conyzicola sp.]|uniref:lipopolysaccharide biosynthesis protein n=1 Tax=Conyzicola sp. TaxID=1969404 RepID=UPI003989E915
MIQALTARLPIAARALTLVLNAALAVVIGRLFGATESGEFFLAFAIVNLGGMLGRLGSENLAIKLLPALFSTGKFDDFWAELRWLRRVCLWGSITIATLLLGVGLGWIAFGPSGNIGIHLAILSISVPFTCLAILHSSALRSAERISMGAFAETGLSQGVTILALVGISIFAAVPSAAISVYYTCASILTAVVSVVWTHRSVPKPTTEIRPVTKTGAEVRSMLQMMGSSMLFFLLSTGPLYALGIAGSVREVGLYNAAARSSTVISLIPALQTTYLVPRVARALASGDLVNANSQLRRATRIGSALGITLALIMIAFSGPITQVFGDDFEGSRPTLLVLVIGQSLILLIGNVNPIMSIAGLERSSLVLAFVTVVFAIPLMLIAAALGGAVAVAGVFIVATICYSLSSALLLSSRLGVRCFIS